MKKVSFFFMLCFLQISCSSIKDVKNNSGAITVGNNNIVINFPKKETVYSEDEIHSNISYLKSVINVLNEKIAEDPSSKKKDDNNTTTNPKTNSQSRPNNKSSIEFNPPKNINELKEEREKAWEAQKAWENLYSNKKGASIFIDEKAKLLSTYRIKADSLEEEVNKFRLKSASLLTSIIENNQSRLDSILQDHVINTVGTLPQGTKFTEELDIYNYRRMHTLWLEKIEKAKGNTKNTTIKITNSNSYEIYIAIRYFSIDNQWITEGWYKLEAGKEVSIPFLTKKPLIYLHGHNSTNSNAYFTFSKGGEIRYTVVKENAFTLLETYKLTGVATEEVIFSSVSVRLGSENAINF